MQRLCRIDSPAHASEPLRTGSLVQKTRVPGDGAAGSLARVTDAWPWLSVSSWSVTLAAPHSRTPNQRTARKDEIRRLLARRYTQAQVAAELQVSERTVSYWVQQLEADVQSAVADRAAEIRATLDSLAEVEREAWAAWERSKQPVQVDLEESGHNAHGPFSKDRTTLRHQVGDPTYLNVVLGCQAQRRALLGLDAPTKAQEFIVAELRAGLERLRAHLSPPLFQQVAGLLAGRTGDAVLIDGDGAELPLDG